MDNNTRMRQHKQITIGFSPHRPETLALAANLMQAHEAVVLEEPPGPWFIPMLKSEMSIENYLQHSDFEFPQFTRHSCQLYRRLHAQGVQLFQCEPYMQRLDLIRSIFDDGGKPEDIPHYSDLAPVYATERHWTAALLAYYENCLRSPFDQVVDLLKHFAREDAARNRLRDELRAQAIQALAPAFTHIYVEAGSLHLPLLNQLRRLLAGEYRITPHYLTATMVKRLSGHRHAPGPGDRLTLHYTYRPGFAGQRADLLAARSLIHSKIQIKEEQDGAASDFPHTRDEIETAEQVAVLSYTDCRQLYEQIKGQDTTHARTSLSRYLGHRHQKRN